MLGLFLRGHGKRLEEYGLPQPSASGNEAEWERRRWSQQSETLRQQVDAGLSVFNPDIFLRVQDAILHDQPLTMFIDGKAGRGKTFLVNTLCAWCDLWAKSHFQQQHPPVQPSFIPVDEQHTQHLV